MHDWLCVGLYYSQRDERERNAYDTETKSSSELCRGGGTAAVRLPQRQQRFRQQGNGLADEAVEPLAGVIFAYLDLFHVTHHLHATIIADFQRIVNTNSC